MLLTRLLLFFIGIATTFVAAAPVADADEFGVVISDAVGPNGTEAGQQLPALWQKVSLGTTKRNVGEVSGGVLYDKVTKALRHICPKEGKGCDTATTPAKAVAAATLVTSFP